MNVGINAQLCSPSSSYRNAGISRYIRQLVTSLGGCRHAPEMHLFLPGINNDEFPPRCVLHRCSWTKENPVARIAWEQTSLPFLIRKSGLDVLHSPVHVLPAVCPCRSVVTILDLTFIRFPQTFPLFQRRYLDFFTRRAVKKADAIIAISESTKRDIVELLGAPEGKIYTTLLGVDPPYRPVSGERKERVAREHGLGHSTILYLGTLEPRKNIPALLAAFSQARKSSQVKDCTLVLAGGKGWFFNQTFKLVEDLGLKESVRFTGYVPAEDLPALYSAATVFVYPSLHEGFGLPPLEAMACGTPVITSNASSLPEVVGDAGIMVDPHNVEELAEAILRVLRDPDLRQEMSAKGLEQAKKFSWKETARQTLKVYERVHNETRG